MDPNTRSMLKVTLPSAYEDRQPIKDLVEGPRGGATLRRDGAYPEQRRRGE